MGISQVARLAGKSEYRCTLSRVVELRKETYRAVLPVRPGLMKLWYPPACLIVQGDPKLLSSKLGFRNELGHEVSTAIAVEVVVVVSCVVIVGVTEVKVEVSMIVSVIEVDAVSSIMTLLVSISIKLDVIVMAEVVLVVETLVLVPVKVVVLVFLTTIEGELVLVV